jgi:dephospho-CoA kinase
VAREAWTDWPPVVRYGFYEMKTTVLEDESSYNEGCEPYDEQFSTPASNMSQQMKTLGLLGGVASGKSLIARQLADLGAVVLDADRAGHEALRIPSTEEAARRRWGDRVFGPDGHIARSQLAKIVFAPPPDGPKERAFLESLTHPEIGRHLSAQIEGQKAVAPLAVLDAALILEAGWDRLCDYFAFVEVPRELRLARALQRGWTEEDFTAREAAQDSLDCKRRRADVIIDNSGSVEHTQVQVQRLWQFLLG